MPETSPTQDQSLSRSASVTQGTGFYWKLPEDDHEALENHPAVTPTADASSQNQTEGASNTNKDKYKLWADTETRLYDAYANGTSAETVKIETTARAERLRAILPQHNHLWDAAISTASAAKTAADDEITAATLDADSNFPKHGFTQLDGYSYGIAVNLFGVKGRNETANSYLRDQAEGKLSESELSRMNDQLA